MTVRSFRGGGLPRTHDTAAEFATDVQYYLTQSPRQLPSRYFYDALGSALFDAICQLPWYRITRAEAQLLSAHRNEVFEWLEYVSTIIELGSGNGEKLRTLVEAPSRPAGALEIHLVDVSANALAWSARALSDVEDVDIVTHETAYESGLVEFAHQARSGAVTLALFLGSNIGNFDRPGAESFLREIRAALKPRDALLIGTDLVKPEAELLVAYDDPLGVTAAFNRNLLVRINRELGGRFQLENFEHRALWNASESRIEMHLVARRPQHVVIEAADLAIDLAEGEVIWTESSYKYRPEEVLKMVERAGFRRIAQWIHDTDGFALNLFAAI